MIVKRIFLRFFLTAALIIIPVCTFSLATEKAEFVSIINLIATPEKYSGKKVTLKGYAIIKFEEMAIYLSKEDAEYMITNNALLLKLNENQVKKYIKFDRDYVLVEGIFDTDKGGIYSGTIQNLTRFEQSWKRRR